MKVLKFYLNLNTFQSDKKSGWTNVGELEGAVHFNIGKCSLFLQ